MCKNINSKKIQNSKFKKTAGKPSPPHHNMELLVILASLSGRINRPCCSEQRRRNYHSVIDERCFSSEEIESKHKRAVHHWNSSLWLGNNGGTRSKDRRVGGSTKSSHISYSCEMRETPVKRNEFPSGAKFPPSMFEFPPSTTAWQLSKVCFQRLFRCLPHSSR